MYNVSNGGKYDLMITFFQYIMYKGLNVKEFANSIAKDQTRDFIPQLAYI